MSVTEKTLIGTIDLTPSWEDQARMCCDILENRDISKKIDAAKAVARTELIRIGQMLDQKKDARKL